MAYIEMLWKCDHCNTENRGSAETCKNCGSPKNNNTKYYMPSQKYNVRVKHIKTTNPDWVCAYCDSLNSDTLDTCRGCGASRSSSQGNYFTINKAKQGNDAKEESIKEEPIQEEPRQVQTSKPPHTKAYRNRRGFHFNKSIIKWSVGVLVSLFLVFLLIPKQKVINIESFEWSRVVTIEEERTVVEEDWSIPSGGREQSRKEKLHHYDRVVDRYEEKVENKSRQVLDHYETVEETHSRQVVDHYETVVTGYRNLGNGYAEEITSKKPVYRTEYYTTTEQKPVYRTEYYKETTQVPVYKNVPVYKTSYTYEIEKWFKCREVATSGKDKDPYWGTIILAEKEREGKKVETYYIVGTDKKGGLVRYTADYEVWKNLEFGSKVSVKVSATGHIVEVVK